MCRNNLFIRLHTSEVKSCCIFKRKTQFKICYGMDIFPGHETFDNLFKQSDWLLRLPLVCFDYFRVSLLLSHKKILTFFQVLFIFSHIQNLTNFDIDSYTNHFKNEWIISSVYFSFLVLGNNAFTKGTKLISLPHRFQQML